MMAPMAPSTATLGVVSFAVPSSATARAVLIDDSGTNPVLIRRVQPWARARGEISALADWWHEATGHMSSPSRIAGHPAYERIIELGKQDKGVVLRYVLEDLNERGGDWYDALEQIAGVDPVPDGVAGNVRAIKQAWLDWGTLNGYFG